ncbi:uncharacterized protein LOC119395068 [Rhipicephalus sanguineus]|uniref:uncharacterized protein LOC119395068 n=1 Tax=Rhipicephalus sanguineus TaxID=34632 RepID=UPI0020C3B234|nr:uncharacterized protein LOC119395068 [Rhipicephalus sanguineus]
METSGSGKPRCVKCTLHSCIKSARARGRFHAPDSPRREEQLVRQCWLANLQREDFDPGTSSRVCSVHFVDGRPTEDNPYPTLRLGTLDVPYKGRRRVTHTAPSQLWPGAPSTGSSPQHHVADEPNDDYSAAFADDDMNDSLPAKNQLGPGIVTYERAFRANKKTLVPTKCLSCGCSCKGTRKMDKGVQAPPEDQDYTWSRSYSDSSELESDDVVFTSDVPECIVL